MSLPLSLGIRREDKLREMRAALAPSHVAALVQQGIAVLVQPSSLRVYPDAAYLAAGAVLTESLEPCDVVIGVKEVPASKLQPGKTMMFFAHVIKAQPAGMPLLDALLQQRVRLLDYEAITRGGVRGGERLVAFGHYAGVAGAIDLLRGLGERCLALGYATPFLGVAACWQYPTLQAAQAAIAACGAAIAAGGLPAPLCPFAFGVTGLCGLTGQGGKVARGARSILELLGVRWVQPSALAATMQALAPQEARTTLLAVGLDIEHVVARRSRGGAAGEGQVEEELAQLSPGESWEGELQEEVSQEQPPWWPAEAEPFDRAHYKAHPHLYRSAFPARFARTLSALLHCSYWEPRFPRLISKAQAAALSRQGALRLLAVGDVSCDSNGPVGFSSPTTIAAPFLVWDPVKDAALTDMGAAPGSSSSSSSSSAGGEPCGRGVLVHCVDHLPSECPRDATDHFGACLLPYLPGLLAESRGGGQQQQQQLQLPPELAGAVVCAAGELTPAWSFIATLRAANERSRAGLLQVLGVDSPRASGASSPAAQGGGGGGGGGSSSSSSSVSGASSPSGRSTPFSTLRLRGHLFDTGCLSLCMDAAEEAGAVVRILDCTVGASRSAATELLLQVCAPTGGGSLQQLLAGLQALADRLGVQLAVESRGSHLRANLGSPLGGGAAGAGEGGV